MAHLEGPPQEKWMRLNDVLKKLAIEQCELMFSTECQKFIGPQENSVLQAFYELIGKV